MAATLKCPNPSCPYLFDPTSVPAGVVLACPRCTMRFTLGAPAAPPPAAPQPSSGSNAVFSSMTRAVSREAAVRESRLPARGSRLQTVLLLGVAAVAVAAAGIAVWYKLSPRPEEVPAELTRALRDLNFAHELPPGPWKRDGEMRARLDSPYKVVYKREEGDQPDQPPAYMALGAKDYETREPRPSELRNALLEPLRKLLEPGTLDVFEATSTGDWLGQEARGFRFRGRLRSGPVIEGEAYSTANQGIGYWFLAWCGENAAYDENKAAFANLRTHCKLLDLRKDWKPRTNVASYKNNIVGYSISDADDVWKEITDEKEILAEDPNADKILLLKLGNRRDIQKVGKLITYILPATGDPMAAARQFVVDKRMAEVKAAGEEYMVEFQDRMGPPEGDPTGNLVDSTAPVIRFESRVKDALNQDRLHVVSAVKIGEKLVVVHAWCDLADRSAFETNFAQIAGSLHVGTDTN